MTPLTLPAGPNLLRLSSRPQLALLLALVLAASLAGCRGSDEPFVIGVAAPLERVYGKTAVQGAQLAVEEINRTGINGRRIQLEIRDDRTEGTTAVTVAHEFLAMPQVLAVLGHVNSGTTRAAAPVYAQGLVALSPSATSPDIAQLSPWIFRVTASDAANSVALAEASRRFGRRIAVIYLNDDYGRALARSFADALRSAGIQPVRIDPYLEDLDDFTPYLERVRRAGVDLIFFAGLEEGAARAITQARALGMDVRFMGGDGIEALAFMGSTYDGTLVGTLYHPEASDVAMAFAERFRAAYGNDPDSPAALAYDGMNLLAEALRAGNRSRPAIRSYLARVGRAGHESGGLPEYRGVTGTIRFDEHGDPVGKDFAVTIVSDGTLKLFNGAH
jgi:branched-chain amino acid transport system substrate-binding protein